MLSSKTISMLEKEEILEIKSKVKSAGKVILEHLNKKTYKIEFKKRNDPVTTADYEANNILMEALHKLFPKDSIVSEETYRPESSALIDENRRMSQRIWIIDPLDGTKDFIKGLPHFAVSVGFLENGHPDFGLIYNPAKNFFIYGGKDYGVFLNNRKFTRPVRKPKRIQDLKICISTSEIKQNLFPELLKVLPEDNLDFIGSVAYKLGLIASGEYDLILSKRPKADWDIAGGIAILYDEEIEILDKNFRNVRLNKDSILTQGLVVGTKSAIQLYKNFIGR